MKRELLVEAIANYMVVEGCAATTSGNRYFSFNEIAKHFELTLNEVIEMKDDIVDELYSKAQICDSEGVLISEDNEFDLMFWGNYCDVDMED